MWEGMLTQVCTIRRPNITNASPHGVDTTIATGVACWVQGGTNSAMSDKSGDRNDQTWTGFFFVGTDIKAHDEIDLDDGRAYEVKFVQPMGRFRAHHIEVELYRKH